MPCDTRPRRKDQTLTQRKEEVRQTVLGLDKLLASRRVRPVVGPQGAITFVGWAKEERNDVSDACAYRRILSTGSALALAEIAQAEALAGRSVNKQALAVGVHSHDSGNTWHGGHK
jgi:hypothetical protein